MPGLMLNEDDSHFYACRTADKLTPEGVHELVDHYATPQMREMVFNVNAMRANFPSKVWTTVWEGFDPKLGLDQPRMMKLPEEWRENAHKAYTRLMDLDLPKHWIQRVREHGKTPWLSIRMNDVHEVQDIEYFSHSTFWREHPEYWRVPDKERFLDWTDRSLDFQHQAVREYTMKLIEEVLERYDFDGLELDWMRFPMHFKPGFEEQGRQTLIEFHREIRALANRYAQQRGHAIQIGVRVPSRPDVARNIGLDAVAWAREGLVDLVAITPFWATIEFDMPVELWRDLLAGTNVTLAAGLEICLRPTPHIPEAYTKELVLNTAETAYGAAAALLHRGADRIYLFNYMDSGTTVKDPEDYRAILNGAGQLDTLQSRPRRHVVTYPDVHAPGQPETHALPARCFQRWPARFRIPIGPAPKKGTAGVFVGLGEKGNQNLDELSVRVNGVLCSRSEREIPSPIHPVARKVAGFDIPDGVLHDNHNYVEVNTTSPEEYEICWMEIMIPAQ